MRSGSRSPIILERRGSENHMPYVYVIKSKTSGKTYIGHTIDLEKRITRHNKELPTKKSSYTQKQGEQWGVIYKEQFLTRNEAILREKELKLGKGREYIKSIVLKNI